MTYSAKGMNGVTNILDNPKGIMLHLQKEKITTKSALVLESIKI